MDDIQSLRERVKKYIETADEKLVRMVFEMLETDANENNRDTINTNIPLDGFGAFPKPEEGREVLPEAHTNIKN